MFPLLLPPSERSVRPGLQSGAGPHGGGSSPGTWAGFTPVPGTAAAAGLGVEQSGLELALLRGMPAP